jgi:AcrR family transcriptional regulator
MVDRPPKTEKKPRRGRPALSEAALSERRAEIAAVAIQLFNDEGYASVSMRRLGKEVGLTPMALYRYFANKLEILTALWDHVIGLAFEDVAAAVGGARDAQDRLYRVSEAYVAYWFKHVEQYQLVFMNADVSKADVTAFVSQDSIMKAYDVFFESIADVLGLTPAHPQVKTIGDGLICHLHGIMHSLITMQGYPWTERDRLVKQAVDMVVSAGVAAERP